MDLQQAQQTLSDMHAGKIQWDDNVKVRAQDIVDSYNPEKIAQKQRAMAMEAIKPAVDSLNAGLPEVANRFDTARGQAEAARNPLLERYENLITDLKSSTQGMIADTEGVWNREAAKRGLSGSSTFTQEERLRRTQPIQQAGDAGVRDVALDRENKVRELDDLIANLSLEQVAAERDIRNTIANLQATAGTGALDRALQQYQIMETARQAELDRVLKAREVAIAEATANQLSTEITEAGGRKLLVNKQTGEVIKDLGATSTGTGTGALNLSDIFGSDGSVLPTKENINSGAYKVTAPSSVDPSLLKSFQTPVTSQSLFGITGQTGAGNINPSITKSSSSVKYGSSVPGIGKTSKPTGSLSGFTYR